MNCTKIFLMAVAATFAATQVADAEELSKRDQLKIQVQAICPVSGQKLGGHGEPVKVKIGKEHIFFCCKACLKKKGDPKHWATIHNNFAKAQRICPVMKKELPQKPKWTIVEGQIVYICCPPCIKKISADPEGYLTKIDELYAASLKTESTRR